MKKALYAFLILTFIFFSLVIGIHIGKQNRPAAFYVTADVPLGTLYSEDVGKIRHLNINTATVEDFDFLPGIGKSTAEAIVEYRTKNGNFQTVDDLLNVPGIGPSKLEALRHLLKVEEYYENISG